MKKLFLVIALFTALSSANASAAALIDCYTDRGFNQNFFYTTQMENGYFHCEDSKGNRLYASFDGGGVGLGIGVEAFKLLFLGLGTPDGEFYGVRVQAAALLGVNVMTLVGSGGFIQVIGGDIGLGADVSGVKFTISTDNNKVRRK